MIRLNCTSKLFNVRIAPVVALAALAASAPVSAQQRTAAVSFLPHVGYATSDLTQPTDTHGENGWVLGVEASVDVGWFVSFTVAYDLFGVDLGCYDSPCSTQASSLHIGAERGFVLGSRSGIEVLAAGAVGYLFGGSGTHDRLGLRSGTAVDIPLAQRFGIRTTARYQAFHHTNRVNGLQAPQVVVWEHFGMLDVGIRITP